MKNKKVLVAVPLINEVKIILESIADVDVEPFITYERLNNMIENYDGFICCPVKCDSNLFKKAIKLKVLSTPGVGYDNIDLKSATENNIIVANVPGTMSESVAELNIGLLLASARKLVFANNSARKGNWDFEELRGIEIWNKTVGQIGCGNIGSLVARKLKNSFSVRLLIYDPYISEARAYDIGGKLVELEVLLRESDIINVNIPLTKETFHMIDKREFSLMKKNVILVNTGRGGIISENALIDSLKKKTIYSAALDVTEFSLKDPTNPLFKFDNVIITPHIGANTEVSYRDTLVSSAKNIISVLNGKIPKNLLNPEVEAVKKLKQSF
jgi:D-3-phosphoglycerate dehydrogenase / 2-oxoglutarate reductase